MNEERHEAKSINPNSQDSFLKQVLELTQRYNGNPQLIYPFLQANVEQLNDNLAIVLHNFVTQTLPAPELDKEKAQHYALVIRQFSNLIKQFPLGNRASNLEIAIAGYKTVLRILDRLSLIHGDFFKELVRVKGILGATYMERLRGEQAGNIEMAIENLKEALRIHEEHQFPLSPEWAANISNLGIAFINRTQGKPAENLKDGITRLLAALQVYNYNQFHKEWENTRNWLGIAYDTYCFKCFTGKGNKKENLEVAIQCFSHALKTYNYDICQRTWIAIKNFLGRAYIDRIKEHRADNLDKAIDCLSSVLECKSDILAEDKAVTQNNLGNAYLYRFCGGRAKNLEAAIQYYRAASGFFTYENHPKGWADIQHNLGYAYYYRVYGEKAENLETAISYFQNALNIRTVEKYPDDYVQTKIFLGQVYLYRIREERLENLKQAIDLSSDAVKISRNNYPELWGMAANILGEAYREKARKLAERVNFLSRAIGSNGTKTYAKAVIFTQQSF